MTEVTVVFKEHPRLTLGRLQNLAEECFGQPLADTLADGADATVTFGFEDAAHSQAFQHCLQCFRLS